MSKVYHRWTSEMENFIKENYTIAGDFVLAEEMNVRYPHRFRWNKKHVEKKRSYLGLKRDKETEAYLRWFANAFLKPDIMGKAWDTRGRSALNTIKKWGAREFIKTPNGYRLLSAYTWELHYGKPRKGFNVVLKNKNGSQSDIGNLECISNAELARRNGIAKYSPELRKTIWALIKLNKSINEKHPRPAGNAVRHNSRSQNGEVGFR